MFCCPVKEFASAVYRYFAHSSAKRAVEEEGGAEVLVGVIWFTVKVPVTVWFCTQESAAVMVWFERHAAALIVWLWSVPTPEQPVPCMTWVAKVVSVIVTIWFASLQRPEVHVAVWPVCVVPPHVGPRPLQVPAVAPGGKPAKVAMLLVQFACVSQVASVSVPAVVPVPEQVTLVCPGRTPVIRRLHAARVSQTKPESTVAVWGAGEVPLTHE